MDNRVLVVDDMELNRELLQEMLESEYEVCFWPRMESVLWSCSINIRMRFRLYCWI